MLRPCPPPCPDRPNNVPKLLVMQFPCCQLIQHGSAHISDSYLRGAPVLSFRHFSDFGYAEAVDTNKCGDAIQVQMWVAMVTEQAVPNRSHLDT